MLNLVMPGEAHSAASTGPVNAKDISTVAAAEEKAYGHTSSLISLVRFRISGKLHGAADRECRTAFLTSCGTEHSNLQSPLSSHH